MKLFSQPTVQNIWLALVLVFSGIIYAQTPGIPYQAYIEDTNAGYVPGEQLKNIPLSHTTVLLQFEVRNDKDVIEYSEEISRPTDKYGMLATVIGVGNGTVTYGDFQNIRWDGTKKTLRTNIDFSNTGNNFEKHGEITLFYMPNPSGGGVMQGLTSDVGAPTATNPANAQAGDVYVDESTGAIYTHDGNMWVVSITASTMSGAGPPTTTTAPNAKAGDIYVDSTSGLMYTHGGSAWLPQNKVVSTDTDNVVVTGTDGLAFLDEAAIQAASGTTTGTGAPTATSPAGAEAGDIYVDESTGDIYTHDGTNWIKQPEAVATGTGAPTPTNPANPSGGDIYVDESTGDVYTYDGTTWVAQSDVVSADTGNLIIEDASGLAFLDAAAVQAASGLTSGTGAPTATSPANAQAGDVYVDESTGDIYTHDGTNWIKQPEAVATGTGAPTPTNPANPSGGDIYVDESTGDVYTYDGTTWVAQSDVVSADTGNLIIEDASGLAFLDAVAVQAASGLTTGTGAPTATSPAGAEAGDVYVDESTGDIYTHDGTNWIKQPEAVATGTGAPTPTNPANPSGGDIYVDESTGDVYTYDGTTWVAQSDVVSADADNLVIEGTDGLAFLDKAAINNIPTTALTGSTTTGDVLTTDAAGDAVWQSPATAMGQDVTSTNKTITGVANDAALAAMDLQVNIDGTTLKADAATGAISVDGAALTIPPSAVTSADVTSTDGSITGVAADAALVAMDLQVNTSVLDNIPTTALTGSTTTGDVLTTDAAGDAVWQSPATAMGQDVTSTNKTITGVANAAALAAMDLQVNIDGTTLKADAATGAISVDGAALTIPPSAVTSEDVTSTNKTITGVANAAALAAMDLQVNIDGTTLKADAATGAISVDGAALTIPPTAFSGSTTTGDVLTTDATGNAVWQAPAAEVDGDITNELNTTFAVSGTNLELTDAGGTLQVPLANIGSDDQDLSLSGGTTLNITDGTGVDLAPAIAAGEVDGDVTNELNTTFTVSGTNLELTDAGGTLQVPLANIGSDDQDLSAAYDTTTHMLTLGLEDDPNATNNNAINLGGLRDNLGNHTASQNLMLGSFGIDNGDTGLSGQVLQATGSGGTDWVHLANLIGNHDVTSTDGTISGGMASSVLVAMDLEVNEANLSGIPATAITAGTANQVLTTSGGVATWQDPTPEVDGSTTNELVTAFGLAGQTLTLTEAGTSHTVALGISSNLGVPTAATAASPSAGDVYVNEANGDIYTYANNAWVTQSSVVDTDDQGLTSALVGTNLTINIDDGTGTTVDLASLDTDTDNQDLSASLSGSTLILALEDDPNTANDANIDLSAINTDAQDLSASLVGTNLMLGLTGDTNAINNATIDLSAMSTDDQNLTGSLLGNSLTIAIEDGTDATVDLSSIDTDDQDLSLNGTTLNITNGTGVNLAPAIAAGEVDGSVTNEIQTLSLSGTALSLSNGGGSVTLPAEVDGSTTNELNTAFGIVGTNLALTDAGGTFNVPLTNIGTDDQDLSLNGTTLNITDGTGVNLAPAIAAAEVDGSVTNEIQTLSLSGTALSLSNGGGSVTLPAEVDGSTTNELNTAFGIVGTNLALTDAGGTLNVPLANIADNLGNHTAGQNLTMGSFGISDVNSQLGGNTQILSSTGTGVDWIDNTAPAAGTATHNTLRWNGTAWVESSALTNDDSKVTATGDLQVGGAAYNDAAYNAGSTTTIDFSQSNLAYTTASAGSFTLNNLKDGGSYTLVVQGATSGTSSFTATGFTFHTNNNSTTIANTHTLYTFIVMGTDVYYSMVTGL